MKLAQMVKIFLLLATKGTQREGSQNRQTRDRGVQQQSQETSTMTSNTATGPKTVTASVGTQNNVGSQVKLYIYLLIFRCIST